ncbi:MAG: hypothetical protein D6734_00310 [Candidatus Schekmanbacteria bacterium]|nr:MAG: hypothetical protein D6734_00310 [Candidatus Schekmanbacteria bacterium]
MKSKKSSISFLAFTTGVFAIILQSVIIREFLVVSFGNELSIALVLAGWLTGIYAGAFISSQIRSPKWESILLYILTFMPFLSFFILSLIRSSREILNIEAGEYFSFAKLFLISFTLIPLSSLQTGLIFPLLCKAKKEKSADNKNPIQWIYVFESAGSLFGGVAFTFILINFFSSFEILTIIIEFSLLAVFLSIEKEEKKSRIYAATVLIFLIIIGYSFGAVKKINDYLINSRWKAVAPDTKLIKSIDTKYQNIAIGERNGQINFYLNGEYSGTLKDEYGFSMTANFIMNQTNNPKKVLLIGGALTGLIKKILNYPIDSLHYVDIDPQLIKASEEYAKKFFPKILSDKRLKKYALDGRYFLARSKEKYDIIILNIPEPHNAVINRFYTEDFFKKCSSKLNKKGIVALSLTLQNNYLGGESLYYGASIYNSLKKVFKNVIATPGEKIFFLAGNSKDSPTTDIPTLEKRFLLSNISDPYFTRFHFRLLLPKERLKFINEKLSSIKEIPKNTDFHPISYFYNLILWDRFSTERSQGFFASAALFLISLPKISYFITVLLFFTVICAIILKFADKTPKALQTIFTTGFCGMASSLILLFSFQNIFGYIYSMVGLLIAIFMGGLTIGGFASSLFSKEEGKTQRGIIFNQCLMAAAFISMPYCLKVISKNAAFSPLKYEILFSIIIFLFGLLTGIQFPLGGRMLIFSGHSVEKSSGYVDALDHCGAFAGAMVTGIILLPILGITLTSFLAGFANLLSVFLWFIRES